MLDDLKFAGLIAYGLSVHGFIALKRAIVAGQYHAPDGLYYGGERRARSHELLMPLLRRMHGDVLNLVPNEVGALSVHGSRFWFRTIGPADA